MADDLTRREVLAAAAALTVAAAFPANASPRPEFRALYEQFLETVATFREARLASRSARPRIMSDVQESDIGAFFSAPEIRARSRARQTASAAARQVYLPVAANDAEAALQETVVRIYLEELGGSPQSDSSARSFDEVC